MTPSQISEAFQKNDLSVFTDASSFEDFVFHQEYDNSVLLLMSSGNYGGLDFDEVKQLLA